MSRVNLHLLISALLLVSGPGVFAAELLSAEIETWIDRLEEEREQFLDQKYRPFNEIVIEKLEFSGAPLIDALEEINARVEEQTGEAINFIFSDGLNLSASVNITLRSISADLALRAVVMQSGLMCSIWEKKVYVHHDDEILHPLRGLRHLNSELRQLNDTIRVLHLQLSKSKSSETHKRLVKETESIVLEDISFQSVRLSNVTDILRQKIKEALNGEDGYEFVLVARLETIDSVLVTYETERDSLKEIVESIAKNIGWDVKLEDGHIAFIPFYSAHTEDDSWRRRLRRFWWEAPGPHVRIPESDELEEGLFMRLARTEIGPDVITLSCELINNTDLSYYFYSNSMMEPEYIIAEVDENGNRIPRVDSWLACGMYAHTRYSPELPHRTLNPFEVDISSVGKRFQIGVKVHRRRYQVDDSGHSKRNILKGYAHETVWTPIIERQPNKALLDSADSEKARKEGAVE